ncbi:hypothetical protein JB92DRAFT_3292739 [Gautieria morchelliformis]|nr:hypothetical protein JB92DRAFT_3292739 [Gautieria morchelliformis]
MPNPLHQAANGDELYTSFMYAWADDVTGNSTKLINAHKNVYLAHANIPGRLLQQEYFVHFISTSPEATTTEQFKARTHISPPCVFNAHTRLMCKYRLVLPGLPADNPQQSEEVTILALLATASVAGALWGGQQAYMNPMTGTQPSSM